MQAFTIPVAFLVEGVDEDDAAQHLTQILADAHLTQDHRATNYKLHPPELEGVPIDPKVEADLLGPIESWWLPNHPTWTGADIEQVLVFAPGTTYTPVTQAMADEAVTYWRRIIEAIGKDALEYPVCGVDFMAGASCILPPGNGGGHRAYE
mgnify:CR=1 FL=1